MVQIIVELKDVDKIENFIAFVQHLDFVETAKVFEEKKTDVYGIKSLLYTPKSAYSVEDIQAIADHFPADKKWTYTDILDYFPPNLKIKVEILNNKLIIMAAPSILHQKISNELSFYMTGFIKKNDLGDLLVAPTDVKFDENNVEQPDILFIAVRKSHIVKKQVVEGAPNLVVEIISPSNDKKEQAEKRDLYESTGVEEYWTIFPKQKKVKVEVLEEGKYQVFSEAETEGVIQSAVLEGFEINLKDLMPDKFYKQENNQDN